MTEEESKAFWDYRKLPVRVTSYPDVPILRDRILLDLSPMDSPLDIKIWLKIDQAEALVDDLSLKLLRAKGAIATAAMEATIGAPVMSATIDAAAKFDRVP